MFSELKDLIILILILITPSGPVWIIHIFFLILAFSVVNFSSLIFQTLANFYIILIFLETLLPILDLYHFDGNINFLKILKGVHAKFPTDRSKSLYWNQITNLPKVHNSRVYFNLKKKQKKTYRYKKKYFMKFGLIKNAVLNNVHAAAGSTHPPWSRCIYNDKFIYLLFFVNEVLKAQFFWKN